MIWTADAKTERCFVVLVYNKAGLRYDLGIWTADSKGLCCVLIIGRIRQRFGYEDLTEWPMLFFNSIRYV